MAVSGEQLRRRLAAARDLAGLDQRAMGARLKAEGLGKTDAARLERGEIEFTPAHHAAYARITGLPAAWFSATDLEALFALDRPVVPAEMNVDLVAARESLQAALRIFEDLIGEATEEPADPTGIPELPEDAALSEAQVAPELPASDGQGEKGHQAASA